MKNAFYPLPTIGNRFAQAMLPLLWLIGPMANAAPAPQKPDTEMAAEVKAIMRDVDEVRRLPVTNMSMVKTGDKTFLISDNGHFVVIGNFKLVDMWQGKIISSMADTHDMEKVDLRKIGLNPDELSAFTIGGGKKEVTLFLDPQCEDCQGLIGQMEALAKDYTFKLVLVPVLGDKSAEITKQLLCHKDRGLSMQSLLAKDYAHLPPMDIKEKACDLRPLQKAVVATKLLDIQDVPYLFLPSKNTFKGKVKSLKALLDKDLEAEAKGK